MPPERREMPAATIRAVEQHLAARLEGTVDFSTGARALYATDASNYRQVPVGVVFRPPHRTSSKRSVPAANTAFRSSPAAEERAFHFAEFVARAVEQERTGSA
jgi:hypothetical protein